MFGFRLNSVAELVDAVHSASLCIIHVEVVLCLYPLYPTVIQLTHICSVSTRVELCILKRRVCLPPP